MVRHLNITARRNEGVNEGVILNAPSNCSRMRQVNLTLNPSNSKMSAIISFYFNSLIVFIVTEKQTTK